MTHRPLLPLILAAALAAAPAMAQTTAPAAVASAAAPAATPPAAAEPTTTAPATTQATTPPGPLAMTIPTPQPASQGAGGLLQTTFALLFVLALLVGGAWFLKRFGPRNFGGGGAGTVKLVGSLSLGTRERILVVEVGEQWIVVGASPGRMNALATMPRQDAGEAAPPATATLQTANFAEWFKQTIDKRNGK